MKKNNDPESMNLGVTDKGVIVIAEENSIAEFINQIGPITKQAALVLFGSTTPELVVQRANEWGVSNVPVMQHLVQAYK